MKLNNTKYIAIFIVGLLSMQVVSQNLEDKDRDGLPDVWEDHFGLATNRADGVDGAYGDPTASGFYNYAQYKGGTYTINGQTYGGTSDTVAGLNPTVLDSVTAGVPNCYQRPTGANKHCLRYLYTDGDYIDPMWKATNGLYGSVGKYDNFTPAFGSTVWAKYIEDSFIPKGTTNEYSGGYPIVTFTTRGVTSAGNLVFYLYGSYPNIIEPTSVAVIPTRELIKSGYTVHLKPDMCDPPFIASSALANAIFAFVDVNGDGEWNNMEPAGITQPFVFAGKKNPYILDIGLIGGTDQCYQGYLTGLEEENWDYGKPKEMRIFADSLDTGHVFPDSYLSRDYLHPGDYLSVFDVPYTFWSGIGSPGNIVRVWVGVSTNKIQYPVTFTQIASRLTTQVVYPTASSVVSESMPTIYYKNTSSLGFALVTPLTAVEIKKGGVTTQHIVQTTAVDDDSFLNFRCPQLLTQGSYEIRVQCLNRAFKTVSSTAGHWSSWVAFTVDSSMPNSPAGFGELNLVLKYVGTGTTKKVVVAAYNGIMMDDEPVAVGGGTITAPELTSMQDMTIGYSTSLTGLKPGNYYIKAWINENDDFIHDSNEAYGYYRAIGDPREPVFKPKKVNIPANRIPEGPLTIYIEDVKPN